MAGDTGHGWPREEEASNYLQRHKITELLNNITSQLCFNQPDNPKEFMIDMLERLAKARTTRIDFPMMFEESNVTSTFEMLDPTKRGLITHQQYKEALLSMGVTEFDPTPPGCDVDRITLDTFTREAKRGLILNAATFEDVKK